jgi:Holliday junction resolvasome RuvABC endonuclease subunit
MISCLGVDPAVNTGLVLLGVEGRSHVLKHSGILTFPILKGFPRLIAMQQAFGAFLDKHMPTIVVIEGYAYGNKFSLATAVEIGTVYRLECMKRNIPVFTFSPTSLKKFILGKGVGKKNLIVMAVFKQWGFEAPTDDVADGYGLALAGLVNKGAVNCTGLQRDAVAAMALLPCN